MMTLPEFRAWVLNELSDAERPSDKLYGILAKMEQECRVTGPEPRSFADIMLYQKASAPPVKFRSFTLPCGLAERRRIEDQVPIDVSYGPFGPEIPL